MKLTQLGSLYKLIRGESRTMRKSVAKQPRQRASAFVLESLENRVLLSATPMEVTTTEPVVTAAVVTTDKPDYAPGETAIITTSNTSADGLKFGDGELVQFQVTRTDGIEDAPMGNLPWYVTDGVGGFAAYQDTIVDSNNDGVAESGDRNADGMADWIRPDTDLTVNGSISTDWFVEDQYLGSSLLLTATGQGSGAVATTEFTDSPRVGTVTVGSQSGVLISGVAGSTNYTFDVFRGSNNNNAAGATVAISGLPVGVTVSGLTTSITLAGTNNTTTSAYSGTFTLNTPLSLAASGYSFTVQVTASAGGGNDSATGAGSLVVNTATVLTPSFTASNKTYNGNDSATVSFTGFSPSVGADAVTVSYTSATFSNANAGTGKTVTIAGLSLSGADAYKYTLSSTTATTTANIAQADANVTINPYSGTYDAAAHNLTGTVVGVAGDLAATGSSLTFGASFINAPGGVGSWTFEGGTNYLDESGTAAITIAQADANVTINPYSGTYDAAAHNLTGTVVGVAGDLAATGSSLTFGASFINAPGGVGSWTFEGGTNYLDESGTAAITIAQADANVTINPYSGTYDAAAHNLTGTVVGVAGDLAATGSSLTFGASFINAPGGVGSWTFEGGTNYLDESGTAAITIAQADANVTINPYSGTYDAAAHNLTGTVVGVAGDLAATGSSLTFGASFINAPGGVGSWTFEGGTNYLDESGTAAITIAQADANVTINPYSGTYDAAAHNLTGTVVGVAGDLAATGSSLTFGASFINAPGGVGSWTFEGGTNYLDESGTAAITIAQADANVTINPYSGTYDAAAHNLTGTVVGVAGDLAATGSSLTFGASFINAPGGVGSWTFEGGTNYLDESGTAAITIAQADANVTINPYSGTYDAAAHNLTGTVVGVAGDLAATGSSLTFGASFINAPGGVGSWTFEGGTNYLDESGTAAITIAQADANVTINPYSGTYDAAAHNLTGTVVGVAGDLAATGSSLTFGASFINAPGGVGSWTFEGGTNYLDESGTAAITIAQADANVTINPYSGTYDAAAHNLTGTVVGVAGDLAATGSSLTFGASFINAPGGVGSWTFEGGTNYLDESGTAAITIAQADANVTINPYSGTYDAAAHNLTGTVVGVAGDLAATGSSLTFGASFINAPGGVGSWTFEGGTNYLDESGTAAITIAQADANVTINPYSGTYDAAAHNLTGTVVGVAGDLAATGSSLTFGASFINAPGGVGSWTFEGGTNYLDESGTAAITIAQADLTITIGSTTKTFGQTINLATALDPTFLTGINGENLSISSYTSAGVPVAALVGPYAITGVVADGTGLASNYTVTLTNGTLTVTTPSVITTVQDGVNLIIVGTDGCDTIVVNASNPSAITVNGAGSYSVGTSGHVIVYGMACDDNISLTGNVNLEAHGGVGSDTITGGAGHDVIFGDTGNDTLTGAAGNDVLVGGSGSDRLVGSAGHDILIAGKLDDAYGYDDLRTLSDNWASNWNDYLDPSVDPEITDNDVVDESVDQLTGSSGHDWYIVDENDKITDIKSATKDGDNIDIIT